MPGDHNILASDAAHEPERYWEPAEGAIAVEQELDRWIRVTLVVKVQHGLVVLEPASCVHDQRILSACHEYAVHHQTRCALVRIEEELVKSAEEEEGQRLFGHTLKPLNVGRSSREYRTQFLRRQRLVARASDADTPSSKHTP
jgi:hypothetical protein